MANTDIFRRAFEQAGFPPHVVDGIIANLIWESGGQTDIDTTNTSGDGGNSWGAAQWNGGRRSALLRFAAERGAHWSDPETQALFVLHELQTGQGGNAGVLDQLLATGNAHDATRVFMAEYERPGVPHLEQRVALLRGEGRGGQSQSSETGFAAQLGNNRTRAAERIDRFRANLEKFRSARQSGVGFLEALRLVAGAADPGKPGGSNGKQVLPSAINNDVHSVAPGIPIPQPRPEPPPVANTAPQLGGALQGAPIMGDLGWLDQHPLGPIPPWTTTDVPQTGYPSRESVQGIGPAPVIGDLDQPQIPTTTDVPQSGYRSRRSQWPMLPSPINPTGNEPVTVGAHRLNTEFLMRGQNQIPRDAGLDVLRAAMVPLTESRLTAPMLNPAMLYPGYGRTGLSR